MSNTTRLQPLRNDVVVKHIPKREVEQSTIFFKDTNTDDHEYYKVLKVGPECKYVNEGDTVITTWARITPPFELDEQKIGVTSENELYAVIPQE